MCSQPSWAGTHGKGSGGRAAAIVGTRPPFRAEAAKHCVNTHLSAESSDVPGGEGEEEDLSETSGYEPLGVFKA